MDTSSSDYAVCILAHNEEKHIARTLTAVIGACAESGAQLYLYANGCTDTTVDIAQRFVKRTARLHLREIARASKPNAWNAAFSEVTADYLVFSDGDILPEPGAISRLVSVLRANPQVVIASSKPWPLKQGLGFQQQLVGFMQLPVLQQFLYGGLYAVRRAALAEALSRKGHSLLPEGVTGEDGFLEFILDKGQLTVADCVTFYEPPDLHDYLRYLARIRWQNDQLRMLLGSIPGGDLGAVERLLFKIKMTKDLRYLLLSSCAVSTKYWFKRMFKGRIDRIYRSLGPVTCDGAEILCSLTRSASVK